MSADHGHYSYDIHGVAEEHHRHYDLENDIEARAHREDLNALAHRVAILESELAATQKRIEAQEKRR